MIALPLPPLILLTSRWALDPASPSGLRWADGRRLGHPAGSLSGRRYWGVEIARDGRRCRLQVHRIVHYLSTGEDPGDREIDHIDRDPSNNQIANLRLCSHQQNSRNLTPREGGSSKFHGVSFHGARDRWRSYIQDGARNCYLGSFRTQEEAALAYDDAAHRIHGAFASLNFPSLRSAS